MSNLKIILVIVSLLITTEFFSQRRGGRHERRMNRRNNVVVIKRSPYRPAKIVVYHPYWRPNYAYNRRWVFFPKYNIYWDNWRNHYVYLNGAVWVSQPTPPPVVVNVNLADEQNQELPEDKDDVDEVYATPK